MELEPVQKARMLAAAEQVRTGAKAFPLKCRHCQSSSVYDANDDVGGSSTLTCAACGHKTAVCYAHQQRKKAISTFISAGVDIPLIGVRS